MKINIGDELSEISTYQMAEYNMKTMFTSTRVLLCMGIVDLSTELKSTA